MWGEKSITGFLYLAVLGGADVMKQGKCYLVLIHQSWIFFLLIVLYLDSTSSRHDEQFPLADF